MSWTSLYFLNMLDSIVLITGDVHEAINLYKDAFQVLKHSKSIALDDELMEKMRIDVAELLHAVGR